MLKQDTPDKSKLEELRNSSSSLRAELKRLSPLRALRTEKRQEFVISRPVLYSLDVYRSRLEKRGVTVEFSQSGDFSVYSRYGAIVQIITNLLDNAYYWLDSVEENKRHIFIQLDGNFRTLVFADSGPGIHPAIIPHLFKPGYSMKIPRSGLGLYISKHYMQEMGGDMQVLFNEKYRVENMPGAQFLLDFAKVKTVKDAD